ncbi:MAG: mismatch-specific DNA-glycosylase [Chloroflexi bacterium]|nr:mismatch-specific DNA-glycosylase [Chloroflexota bacterium]
MTSSEPTLPDHLCDGLDIVFVGINPGAYSATVGQYFATSTNRFWRAFSRSGIVDIDRDLVAGDEAWLNNAGVGFTDVVKRASASASSLKAADYRYWAPLTLQKLEEHAPLVVCFNGLTGYQAFARYSLDLRLKPKLGEQAERIGSSRGFVAPNPSAANAAFSLDVIAGWYQKLRELRDTLKSGS